MSDTKALPAMPRTKEHHQALHCREVPDALDKIRKSTADTCY